LGWRIRWLRMRCKSEANCPVCDGADADAAVCVSGLWASTYPDSCAAAAAGGKETSGVAFSGVREGKCGNSSATASNCQEEVCTRKVASWGVIEIVKYWNCER
jgi:hypothetical protein